VITQILDAPELAAKRGRNAQRLIQECLTWDKTIDPLDTFCRAPVKRQKEKLPMNSASQSMGKQLRYLQKNCCSMYKMKG